MVNVLGVVVGTVDSETFADTNAEEEYLPELREDGLNSLETGERGRSSNTIEERMEFLSHDPTEGSKHGHTAMSDLSLAVTLGLRDGEGRGLGELQGIEESHGCTDAGEGEHVVLATGAGSGSLQSRTSGDE